jgi:hypothetical protein
MSATTDNSTTQLYPPENNCKLFHFQVRIDQYCEQAEYDLQLGMGKLAKHGQSRRQKTSKGTEGINAEQAALLRTAMHSHKLKCLASQLRVVGAWVLPCVSARVCSVYCGQLLDVYDCILQDTATGKAHTGHVPQETMVHCRQLTYQFLEHIQTATETHCASTQEDPYLRVVPAAAFAGLLESCFDIKRVATSFVQVHLTLSTIQCDRYDVLILSKLK